MSTFRATVADAALRVAAVAAACNTVSQLASELLPVLGEVCGAELVIFHQVVLVGRVQEYGVHWPRTTDMITALAGYPGVMQTSPLVRHFTTSGEAGVISVGELLSRREWHAHPVYVDSFNRVGIDDHLAVMVSAVGGRCYGFSLARGGRNFGVREHQIVDLASPHLLWAARRAITSLEPYSAIQTLPVPQMCTVLGPAIAGPSRPLLTSRQSEVLGLVASGLGSRQIARRMGVAPRTVEKHLEDVYRRLGTTNRIDTLAVLSEAYRRSMDA